MTEPDEGGSRIAEKLNHLFHTVHRGDGEYSNKAVAEAIAEKQGVQISHTYIWQLRTGRRDNPTIQHLTALAKFFGVPVVYFLDDAETARINQDLELLAAMREAGITEIALRTADLSDSSRTAVGDMVTQLWRLEHPSAET
ncbi:helix-turn-helix domain-containing protein [Kibdelosporangium philippinense]|uniref:Helix-turn-helix domain-containing protein n=1 Tax=Kibdelosporangium philippinense TaxID=211113 RepID=A0ABS8ZKB8_9PSEU|nr:helix-turn-helix domain-containing protein [Kibdelosporangium philippinense]MCE7008180.1 helix-turn-helix domain-containing protein [Kibdelosporangium philippinense]